MKGADGLVVFEAAKHRDTLGYGMQLSFLIKEEQELAWEATFAADIQNKTVLVPPCPRGMWNFA